MAGTDSSDRPTLDVGLIPRDRAALCIVVAAVFLAVGISPTATQTSAIESAFWQTSVSTIGGKPTAEVMAVDESAEGPAARKKMSRASRGLVDAVKKRTQAKKTGLAPFPLVVSHLNIGSEAPPAITTVVFARTALGGLPFLLTLLLVWHWLVAVDVSVPARRFALAATAAASPLVIFGGMVGGAMWATFFLSLGAFAVSGGTFTTPLRKMLQSVGALVALPVLAVVAAPSLWPAAVVVALFSSVLVPRRLRHIPLLCVVVVGVVSAVMLDAPALLFRGWPSFSAMGKALTTAPLWVGAILMWKPATNGQRGLALLFLATAVLRPRGVEASGVWGAELLPLVPVAAVMIGQGIARRKNPWIWAAVALAMGFCFIAATTVWPFPAKVPSFLGRLVFVLLGDGWLPPSWFTFIGLPTWVMVIVGGGILAWGLLQPVWLMTSWERMLQGAFFALVSATLLVGGVSALAKKSSSTTRIRKTLEESYRIDPSSQPHFRQAPRGVIAEAQLQTLKAASVKLSGTKAKDKGAKSAVKVVSCGAPRTRAQSRSCPGYGNEVRFSIESIRFLKKLHVAMRLPIPKKGGASEIVFPAGTLETKDHFRFAIPDKHWRESKGKPVFVSVNVGGKLIKRAKVGRGGLVVKLKQPVGKGDTVSFTTESTSGDHMPFWFAQSLIDQ